MGGFPPPRTRPPDLLHEGVRSANLQERHIVGLQCRARKAGTKSQELHATSMTWFCPACFTAQPLRSNIARGKIGKICFDPSIAWDQFVLVTAKTFRGKLHLLILDDQPCLAAETVNHPKSRFCFWPIETVACFVRPLMRFLSSTSRSRPCTPWKKASSNPLSSGHRQRLQGLPG